MVQIRVHFFWPPPRSRCLCVSFFFNTGTENMENPSHPVIKMVEEEEVVGRITEERPHYPHGMALLRIIIYL